jgi:hypothetical protein
VSNIEKSNDQHLHHAGTYQAKKIWKDVSGKVTE